MTTLRFIVEGAPVAWKRTATSAGRRVTPRAQREYQSRVRWAAHLALRGLVWSGADRYAVTVDVHRDRRKADCDNAAKTVADACNGLVWDDDSQIDDLRVRMHRGSKPYRVEVTVEVM